MLQFFDLLAEWRLGDVHLLSGAAKVEGLSDSKKIAEMAQLHGESLKSKKLIKG
jgi:hypothetical protein